MQLYKISKQSTRNTILRFRKIYRTKYTELKNEVEFIFLFFNVKMDKVKKLVSPNLLIPIIHRFFQTSVTLNMTKSFFGISSLSSIDEEHF